MVGSGDGRAGAKLDIPAAGAEEFSTVAGVNKTGTVVAGIIGAGGTIVDVTALVAMAKVVTGVVVTGVAVVVVVVPGVKTANPPDEALHL